MADNTGGPPSPFNPASNSISYNEMVRAQMVSQYTNYTPQPPKRTTWDEYNIAREPRYQYGVPGGQDQRRYQRQNELNASAYSAAAANVTMSSVGWAAGTGVAAAAGVAGWPAIAIGAGVAAIGAPWTAGVAYSMQRRKFMASMASDVEMYRDRAGFNSLSYNQATDLGRSIGSQMLSGGGYFNKEQQSRIHKIGLANDMLDARSPSVGINNIMKSGTIGQYKQNLNELTKTAEEAVKIMNTTIEGAMSVIKELKGQGLSTSQARQQIRQAAAYGKVSGMGTMNMMQVAQAGANMVQGTPWSGQTGAAMSVHHATSAALMAQASPGMQYAVQRAGGAAAAGTQLAAMQMNVLQSGIGTKMVAAAMNPDGSINSDKLRSIMSREHSGYTISSMANATGYAMGAGGRVMFPFAKQRALEGMSVIEKDMLSQRGFDAWRSGRGGNREQQAYAFAGTFTDDMRQQELFAKSLITNPQWQQMHAATSVQNAMMAPGNIMNAQSPWTQLASAAGRKFIDPTVNKIRAQSESLIDISNQAQRWIGNVNRTVGRGWNKIGNRLLSAATGLPVNTGYEPSYGGMGYETALAQTSGADANMTPQEMFAAQKYLNKYGVNNITRSTDTKGTLNIGKNALNYVMANTDAYKTVASHITRAMAVGTVGAAEDVFRSEAVSKILKTDGRIPTITQNGIEVQDPRGALNILANTMNHSVKEGQKYDEKISKFQTYLTGLRKTEAGSKIADHMESRAAYYANAGMGKGVVDANQSGLPTVVTDAINATILSGNAAATNINVLMGSAAQDSAILSASNMRAKLFGGEYTYKKGPTPVFGVDDNRISKTMTLSGQYSQFLKTNTQYFTQDTFVSQGKRYRTSATDKMAVIKDLTAAGMSTEAREQYFRMVESKEFGDFASAEEKALGIRGLRKAQAQANAWVNMLGEVKGIDASSGKGFLMSAILGGEASGTLSAYRGLGKAAGSKLLTGMSFRSQGAITAAKNLENGTFGARDATALQTELQTQGRNVEAQSYQNRAVEIARDSTSLLSLMDKAATGKTLDQSDLDSLKSIGVDTTATEGNATGWTAKDSMKADIKSKGAAKMAELANQSTIESGGMMAQLFAAMSGKGTSATVSPPIMNYWNNRWTL